tara:strand:+ start:345 stop:599 length:255 start_codon:yes stop_codon:yes gene_type:complete
MSQEKLKAFLEKVKGDLSLQEKLKAAKSPEDVVSITKDHGHDFGSEAAVKWTQLSEDELEGVSGGKSSNFTCPCGVALGCGITI